MRKEIQVRLKGNMEALEAFIKYLEKENILTNQSEYKEDDSCYGRGFMRHFVFVTVVPKQVVEQ